MKKVRRWGIPTGRFFIFGEYCPFFVPLLMLYCIQNKKAADHFGENQQKRTFFRFFAKKT